MDQKNKKPKSEAKTKKSNSKSNNRFSKSIKTARKNLDKTGRSTSRHTRKFILDRLDNLRLARRETALWLVLVAVLIIAGVTQATLMARNTQTAAPTNGGAYIEGTIDKVSTINPLFAITDSEKAASRLVYSSLLSFDDTNNLRGDIATTWFNSEDGKSWTVNLRQNISWSDGKMLTADDVIFTVELMKNKEINSPLYDSWRNVNVEIISKNVVKFTTENPYMSFPFALTFGILPKHIFEKMPAEKIRNFTGINSNLNIASGPFRSSTHEILYAGQTIWRFSVNENYFGAKPRIKSIAIRTYENSENLAAGLKYGEINAASGMDVKTAINVSLSDQRLIEIPTADGVFTIFNTDAPEVSNLKIREALRLGSNRDELRKISVNGKLKTPNSLEMPIAKGIYESIDEMKQPNFSEKEAKGKLNDAGWKLNNKNLREKNGQILTLNVLTVKDTDYESTAKALADQWRKLGIDVKLTTAEASMIQQNYLIPRSYDVLIYKLHLGMDPDGFAYWSSSQASLTGLNFANYQSRRADLALSAGRTQLNPETREARYNDFVKLWLNDIPAIALYQPNFYYATKGNLNTLNDFPLASAEDRFRDIANWTIRTQTVNKTP